MRSLQNSFLITMPVNRPFEFFIQWHLTEACNLRCRHCYQNGNGPGTMSFSAVRRAIAEAADMIREWSGLYGISFAPSVNITGGEPFLREDLFEIIGEARKEGFAVSLLTNGTLVDRERARRLADLDVEAVQVSIEGPAGVHDRIRGPGSHAAAAAGIEHLVASGLEVTLNMTLSELNAAGTASMIAFGADAGARRIGFSRLVPSGGACGLISHMLKTHELKQLYSALLAGDHPAGIEIVTGDPVAAQMNSPCDRDAGNVAVGGCAAGISGLTILPDGSILPCRRLPVKIGSVQEDSLREVWAASPVLEALRDRSRYRGRCGSCPRWAVCRGCRAIAHAWSLARGNADFLADDPQCFIDARHGSENRVARNNPDGAAS